MVSKAHLDSLLHIKWGGGSVRATKVTTINAVAVSMVWCKQKDNLRDSSV
jgi:hypothetical protein